MLSRGPAASRARPAPTRSCSIRETGCRCERRLLAISRETASQAPPPPHPPPRSPGERGAGAVRAAHPALPHRAALRTSPAFASPLGPPPSAGRNKKTPPPPAPALQGGTPVLRLAAWSAAVLLFLVS